MSVRPVKQQIMAYNRVSMCTGGKDRNTSQLCSNKHSVLGETYLPHQVAFLGLCAGFESNSRELIPQVFQPQLHNLLGNQVCKRKGYRKYVLTVVASCTGFPHGSRFHLQDKTLGVEGPLSVFSN